MNKNGKAFLNLKLFLKRNITLVLIFSASFFVYLINLPLDYSKSLETRVARRLLTSNDVIPATFLPYEIRYNGTLSFSKDTFKAMLASQQEVALYSIIKYNGRYLSAMPILSGILAVPIYIVPILLNKIPTLQYYENILKILALGRIAASFYTSISVVIFYLILKEVDKIKKFPTDKWTTIFLIFFAFGTNTYAVASRSLWQHTSSLLLVNLIIYFLLKSIQNEKYIKWLGLLSALLYIARPVNLIFVSLVTLYVFMYHKKHFVKYLLYALPFALLLFSYNIYAWGNPFTSEYIVKKEAIFSIPLWYGVLGYLFSPARSFLFVSPPLALSYYLMFMILKKKKKDRFEIILSFLTITYLLFLIPYSTFHVWDGGSRFGYGFFTEWVPIVALLSYIVIKPMKKTGKIILSILILWSIYVQFNAVWFRKSRCTGPQHDWDFYCLMPPKELPDY